MRVEIDTKFKPHDDIYFFSNKYKQEWHDHVYYILISVDNEIGEPTVQYVTYSGERVFESQAAAGWKELSEILEQNKQ